MTSFGEATKEANFLRPTRRRVADRSQESVAPCIVRWSPGLSRNPIRTG